MPPVRLRLSLDLLRGFHAAAQHLSFTRAAQDLFVTQSAISREVKTLEEQLGKPLFHRVNRALRLTTAGEDLYRATEETLAQLDAVIERIAGSGATVSVTTTPALASLWLAPRLPRFNARHPGIDVRVVASNDRPDLARDRIDIALYFVKAGGALPDGQRLFECQTFPVCSRALACHARHPIRTPGDLARHVRLDYESLRDGRRFSEWNFWFDGTLTRRVTPASTLQFPQYDQVVAAAIEGSGVAIGVLPHVAEYLREGSLVAPFGREAVAWRGTFFVVRRPGHAGGPAIEAFIDWLWSELRSERPVDLSAPRLGRTRASGTSPSRARRA